MWQRYKVHTTDGHLLPLVQAINEMYVRIGRIENKLDLLLGQRPPLGTGRPPVMRHVTLDLPVPPIDSVRRATKAPRRIELDFAWSMYVGRVLADRGIAQYESTALPHFLTALEMASPGAVFDVGANLGPYALLARAFSDRDVVGFEPTPDLASTARKLGQNNGLDYMVEEVALGDSDGTVQLYLSDSTDSSNSLNPSFRRYSNILDVPLERLDSYVARTGRAPSVIKVDTETTEPAVLRGAQSTIRKHRPWIFCEVLFGQTEKELTDVVQPWGYTWYHLVAADELTAAEEIVGDPTFKNFMYLFAPEPLTESYWQRVRQWDLALQATTHPVDD